MTAIDIYNQAKRDGLPVDEVSGSVGAWSITWTRNLTQQEQSLASTVEARAAEYALQAEQWSAFLAGGWTDSETGLKLKTRHESFALFSAMQTGLAEGIALGAVTNDTPVTVWDFSDTEHTVSVNTARRLLFRYVLAWKTAFDAYAP